MAPECVYRDFSSFHAPAVVPQQGRRLRNTVLLLIPFITIVIAERVGPDEVNKKRRTPAGDANSVWLVEDAAGGPGRGGLRRRDGPYLQQVQTA